MDMAARQLGPKPLVIGLGLGAQALIVHHAPHIGLGHERCCRREDTGFSQDRFDVGHEALLLWAGKTQRILRVCAEVNSPPVQGEHTLNEATSTQEDSSIWT